MTTKLLVSASAPPPAKAKRKAAIRKVAPYGPNPGHLEHRLHLPTGLRRGAPLVVLLHGCGQEPEALAKAAGWVRLADQYGLVLLMPRQTEENNRQRCFNWYRPADIYRDQGEAASIRAMVAYMLARHHCDPARVFVTGLSAGGAMTACLLAAYPEVFAAGAVVAGLPAGAATGVVSALSRMAGHAGRLSGPTLAAKARALGPVGASGPLPRLSVWHGTADHVVAPSNAIDLIAQWITLQGLSGPGETEPMQAGLQHIVWPDGAGRIAVELWSVAGMGHCYPVAEAFSPDSHVPPTPVWTALEVLRFWGIAEPDSHRNLNWNLIPSV